MKKKSAKICEKLKRYVDTGEMETGELKSLDCITCYKKKGGIDIFCKDYSSHYSKGGKK